MEYDYEYFKNEILKLTGINLHLYKENQMKRRINTLIERQGISGYREFIEILQNDHIRLTAFVDYITINVTEFFRTSEHWKYFEEEVLPELIEKKGEHLKIWSTACSDGEEPYSIVMSLAKYLPLSEIRILATDLDKTILKAAKKGIFSDKSMENVPDEMKERYFSKTEKNWIISDEIKECVEFKRLDLLRDEYPKECDLIVCRNVLIYFTEEAKNRIYSSFYESLSDGGCLFTGNTEQIIQYKKLGFNKEKNFIYRK